VETLKRTEKNKIKQNKENKSNKKKKEKQFLSLTQILSIIIVGSFIFFFAGAMLGYGVLGKKPASEVFNIETWKHIWQLIFG